MPHKSVNATRYEYIPAFASGKKRREHVVNAIVETPKGSCKKYALEPSLGIIAFHNHLPAKFEWPYDYGFIPQTLAPDGDGVDILVINDKGLFSGCLIAVRVLGAICERKDGVQDDRVIAVPLPTPGVSQPTDEYRDISDIPKHEIEHITKFLAEYPALEGHKVEIAGFADARGAMNNIKAAMKTFKKRKGK
jgi:inorganic pyrophosphatase